MSIGADLLGEAPRPPCVESTSSLRFFAFGMPSSCATSLSVAQTRRALAHEGLRDRAADALPRRGDDRDLALQTPCHASSLPMSWIGIQAVPAAETLETRRLAPRHRNSRARASARRPPCARGHSLSRIENQAVSRFWPFTTMCWRNRPSYWKPKRSAARLRGLVQVVALPLEAAIAEREAIGAAEIDRLGRDPRLLQDSANR